MRFTLPRRLNYLLKQAMFFNQRLTFQESIERNSNVEDKCNNIRSLLGTSLSFKSKYVSNKSSLKTSFVYERPQESVDYQKRFVQNLMKLPDSIEIKSKPLETVQPAFSQEQSYKSKIIIRSLPKTITLPSCIKRVQLRLGESLEPNKLWLKRMEQLKKRNRVLLEHAFNKYGLFQQNQLSQSHHDLDQIEKKIKDQSSTTHFKDSSSIPDQFMEQLLASTAKQERPQNLRVLQLTGEERRWKGSVYRMNRTCKSVKKSQKVLPRAALQIQGKGI